MSRIGFQRGSARRPNHSSPIVLSHEGGELYAITDPAQYLLSSACYLGEPGFYADRELSDPDNTEFSVLDERGRAIMKAARELALGPNPEDLLIIAHWARQSMNMRLFPQLLMTAAARWLKARSGEEQPICRYMPKVCSRPDDLLQVFALTNLLFGQPKSEKVGPRANFPQRLKKAMARTLSQYSLYKLVKYNRPQHHPNYADVLGVLRCRGLMRPRAEGLKFGSEEAQACWPWSKELRDYLIDGRVSAGLPAMIRARADFHRLPESASLEEIEAHASVGRLTWEELVSKFGARSSPRRNEVWRIAVRQMPSLALLRNLRNALEAGVPKLAKKLSKLFSDEAIQSSKILPLRFFQAFDALRQSQPEDPRESQRVLAELIRILDRSAELNVPLFRGMTAVFVDVSGSMLGRISANSTLSVAEAAGCMASILTRRAEDAALFVFDMGTPAKLLELPKGEPAMKTAERIRANCSGGGTDLNLVFRALLERGLKPERVVILSDNQSHHGVQGSAEEFFKRSGGTFLHCIDLQDWGQSILPESWPRLNLLSGFSEKVFSLIQAFEKSQDSGSAGSSSIPRPVLEELRAKFRIPPGSPSQDQTPAAA